MQKCPEEKNGYLAIGFYFNVLLDAPQDHLEKEINDKVTLHKAYQIHFKFKFRVYEPTN